MAARRKRVIYLAVRFGMLAAALGAVASGAVKFAAPLGAQDIAALAACLLIFVMLLRINVPLLSSAQARRRQPLEPGRLTLETPVMLAVLAFYGPIAAALVNLIGYPLAIPSDGRSRVMRRVLDGGGEAFLWLVLGALQTLIVPRVPQLSPGGYALYTIFFTCGIFAYLYVVWQPLKALTQSVLLVRLWGNLARDTRLVLYVVLVVSWGYVATLVWQRAGVALGLAVFAPLPFIATALRSLHAHQMELHRLRLARDAVQAMLGARDPLPQMSSLLGSLHTPSADESLQIYGAMSPEERLSALARIGPALGEEQLAACRRAVLELQHHAERTSTTLRARDFAVVAYAVRAANDALLGALIVVRPAHTASLLPARRFAQAAAELAPLLRDFRSITATQNAATLDPLTGLPNRRSIMEYLRDRIESVSIGNPCAVLLIDIDHFKSINDTQGHQAGDRCLRAVGKLIAANIRHMDRAGRIGGEEFVILMPDTTSEMARMVGERLRSAIASAEIRYANGDPLTASIGVAVAAISDTVDSLLARADRALYQAKAQGRNRVIEISA
ncbi:MAG TPA: GGDEF domain-containing protein [Candidatus Baltobacteraceae bacterium]|nr:GGDEF domain-containing protein [Candidatus Baltobacteraceae bacterium]